MGKVTAILNQRRRRNKVKVFLDNRAVLNMTVEIAVSKGLHVGQELSDVQIKALVRSECYQRCLNAAFPYLSYRPRSESELNSVRILESLTHPLLQGFLTHRSRPAFPYRKFV